MPPAGLYNGKLIIYAHGYVAPNEPVGIPADQLVLPGGISIPQLVTSLGFGFAATSYPANGLVLVPGVQDLRNLANFFDAECGAPSRTILGGVSEGGLIATKALEQYPAEFNGALAACGPIGDFRDQVNYIGDFRVVYDYFFPGVLPPTAVDIPPQLIAGWETVYRPLALGALASNAGAAKQLFSVARVPLGSDPAINGLAAADRLLWYSVFATNNAREVLGGQPFQNKYKWYSGSLNDFRLNLQVARFSADAAALANIQQYYQTSGRLSRPLVTLHNLEDPVVPYWHESQYWLRAFLAGRLGQLVQLPSLRYGHCNFSQAEVVFALGILLAKIEGNAAVTLQPSFDSDADQAEYRELAGRHAKR
jgi:pimeloyl-ACP methyl ester carboxylesterase